VATYTLSNGLVSFAFVDDATFGFKFIAMLRTAQIHVWGNHDGRLWTATLFDAIAPQAGPVVLDPDRAHVTALQATAGKFEATWSDVPALGGDLLNVTFRARLEQNEDFLRCTLEASWSGGAARTALDAISVLPLAVPPFQRGDDAACMAMIGGILSRDPITHLRHAAAPNTPFGTLSRNEWFFPSGHGWSMPLWGYYETRTKQGWMAWLEEFQGAPTAVLFESDGSDLVLRASEPQPDHVVAGNGGQPLGMTSTLCLRPLSIRTRHGWAEIGQLYRDRYEATEPIGFVPQRAFRKDLSEKERAASVFVDIEATGETHAPGDGKPGEVVSLLQRLRAGAGISLDVPMRGTVEGPSYNLDAPREAPNGDLAKKMLALPGLNVFLSVWYPNSLGPELWDLRQWIAPASTLSDRRWHTTWDVIHLLHESRSGFLDGDGDDTLLQERDRYYRERTYPVLSFTPPTRTVTVAGSPASDGFVGDTVAILVRGTTLRLAQAQVEGFGPGMVLLAGLPTDSAGVERTPRAGDSLVVRQALHTTDPLLICPHAALQGEAYFAALRENVVAGIERNAHVCGRYVDAWTSVRERQPDDGLGLRRIPFCYRDHLAWTQKDGKFTSHPRGGGTWLGAAYRDFAAALRQSGRDSQSGNGREVCFFLATEFLDEYTHDLFDVGFTPVGTGRIWRNTDGVDPADHRYLAVPLYALVHAGRVVQRALNQEFSTALADPSKDRPELREFLAFCLASDWPYGMTAPTFSFFQSDTIPMYDLFAESIYRPLGAVSRDVRRVRDLWVQIVQAELRQAAVYMHEGQMMIPAELVDELTDTTTGMAQSTFANDYHTYDVLYDRADYPRVTHGCWRARDGSVMVVLSNWTFRDARWGGVLDLEGFGFDTAEPLEPRPVTVRRTDAFGAASADVAFDRLTGRLVLANVAALSVTLVTLRQAEAQPGGS
jgi:hypothetical protein